MRTFLLALAFIVAWLLVAPGMARACDQQLIVVNGQVYMVQAQPMFAQPQAVYGFAAVQARVPRTPIRTFGRALFTRPAAVSAYGAQGIGGCASGQCGQSGLRIRR
jgi:hypothetical protein